MAENQTSRDLPAITRETMDAAIETLAARRALKTSQVIPQAVYLDQLPNYNDFFAKFLVPNQLCILSESATRQWRSRREWVCEDGSPNFDFLQAFGEVTVPIANCKHKEFSAHAKQEMTMSEFLTYWQKLREAGHPCDDESLYLKDWHFTRAFPDYNAYSTCSFFRSDWMNEFWDVRDDIDDDYRFVYMGPKGTWTPFHADVFRSFSWSANICGRKRWIFFPPGEEEHLKDQHGNLVFDVTSEELEDPHKVPNACKVQHRVEVIQHPGETIFVPSGWHHQVENLEDTISINHNWLNGCNVRLCWAHIKASLADVQREISDCRDMDEWDLQCQRILRAFVGLDYCEFFRFMESIAKSRIGALQAWKQRTASSSTSGSSCCCCCCCDCAASRGSIGGVVTESKETATGSRKSDMPHDDPHRNWGSVTGDAERSDRRAGTERQRTSSQDPSRAEEDRSDRCRCHSHSETDPAGEGVTRCGGEMQPHELSIGAGGGEVCAHPKHTHAALQSDRSDTRCVTPDDKGLCSFSSGDPSKKPRVSTGASQSEADACWSELDLSDSSGAADSDLARPHWSRCNVYHALFDLASVAMVLKDMMQTSELSALLGMERDKEERGPEDVSGRRPEQPDKDESGPEQVADELKAGQLDENDSDPDERVPELGVDDRKLGQLDKDDSDPERGKGERVPEQVVDELKPEQLDKDDSDPERGKGERVSEQGVVDVKPEQLDKDDSDPEQGKGERVSEQGVVDVKPEQLDKDDSDPERGKGERVSEQGVVDVKPEQLDKDDSDPAQGKDERDPGEDKGGQEQDSGNLKPKHSLEESDAGELERGQGGVLGPELLLREISQTLIQFGVELSLDCQ